jgi:hypothetical protein
MMITQPDWKTARPASRVGRVSVVPPRATDSAALPAPTGPDALTTTPEEALIADTRAGLTPSQLVERKLISLLKSSPLPISHVQIISTGISRRR